MATALVETKQLTYQQRIDALRATKMAQTREKWQIIGSMDHDDWALILPPEEYREVVQAISGSGMPITDVLIKGLQMDSNHPNGGFYGPKACGENFGKLLRLHPTYIDPLSSLAGAYMVNFGSYRKHGWKPEFDFSHLHEEQRKYKLGAGIGAGQHFCQDLQIGLDLGWGGILAKICRYRSANPQASDFYDGLEAIVTGMQDWIARNAQAARQMAETENDPALRRNLLEMAEINEWLVSQPPRTFREAC